MRDLQNPVDGAIAFVAPVPVFLIVAALLVLALLALAVWAWLLNRQDMRQAQDHLNQMDRHRPRQLQLPADAGDPWMQYIERLIRQ